MHIMGELQTNKANFLFKKTQDFYQTTHAATHLATIITDNIILYFNYQVSVLHLFKRSHNGMSWGVCHTLDILVKCRSVYALLISPRFSNMAAKQQFQDSDL